MPTPTCHGKRMVQLGRTVKFLGRDADDKMIVKPIVLHKCATCGKTATTSPAPRPRQERLDKANVTLATMSYR